VVGGEEVTVAGARPDWGPAVQRRRDGQGSAGWPPRGASPLTLMRPVDGVAMRRSTRTRLTGSQCDTCTRSMVVRPRPVTRVASRSAWRTRHALRRRLDAPRQSMFAHTTGLCTVPLAGIGHKKRRPLFQREPACQNTPRSGTQVCWRAPRRHAPTAHRVAKGQVRSPWSLVARA
jgi:hypothetical protein